MAEDKAAIPGDTERPTLARIEIEQKDKVAIVALNRPDVHNAMDDALRGELVEVMGREPTAEEQLEFASIRNRAIPSGW